MNRRMCAVAMALLALAGSAAAQQTPAPAKPPAKQPMKGMTPAAAPSSKGGMRMGGMKMGGMQMGGMQMGGMMEMMRPQGAAEFLGMRSALGLTPDQVQRLTAIRERARTASQPHMEAAMKAHHAAMEALEKDAPDVAGYEARLREAMNHGVEGQVALAHARVDALAVLTPEQRTKVLAAERQRHDRMMKGMMGGMEGMEHMGGMKMEHAPAAGAAPGGMHMEHPPAAAPAPMQHDSAHQH